MQWTIEVTKHGLYRNRMLSFTKVARNEYKMNWTVEICSLVNEIPALYSMSAPRTGCAAIYTTISHPSG
jgi:hypothetical protein